MSSKKCGVYFVYKREKKYLIIISLFTISFDEHNFWSESSQFKISKLYDCVTLIMTLSKSSQFTMTLSESSQFKIMQPMVGWHAQSSDLVLRKKVLKHRSKEIFKREFDSNVIDYKQKDNTTTYLATSSEKNWRQWVKKRRRRAHKWILH